MCNRRSDRLSAYSDPPDPSSIPAEAADVDGLVRDAVIRLTRLVQRAAIYPAGHPTVRLLLAPFLDATAPFTHGMPLTLAVRKRPPDCRGGRPPRQEHESKWLAGQLHGRGVAPCHRRRRRCRRAPGFARWLSGPASAGEKPSMPGGFAICYVDYTGAAYDEAPVARARRQPRRVAARRHAARPAEGMAGDAGQLAAERFGDALAAARSARAAAAGTARPPAPVPVRGRGNPGLLGGPGPGDAPIEPQGIASSIQRELALSEGTGVTRRDGTPAGRRREARPADARRKPPIVKRDSPTSSIDCRTKCGSSCCASSPTTTRASATC